MLPHVNAHIDGAWNSRYVRLSQSVLRISLQRVHAMPAFEAIWHNHIFGEHIHTLCYMLEMHFLNKLCFGFRVNSSLSHSGYRQLGMWSAELGSCRLQHLPVTRHQQTAEGDSMTSRSCLRPASLQKCDATASLTDCIR